MEVTPCRLCIVRLLCPSVVRACFRVHFVTLDCHADADFAGNCSAKEVDNPSTMQSRTGFVITLGSVPVLWKSVIQSEITLSTVEAECIAPSTAMGKLIQLQTVLFEIKDILD